MTQAEEVFRIEFGKNYNQYSNEELKRRLWKLEQAVWQLQRKVFHLETGARAHVASKWVCTLSTIGNNYSATGFSRAEAKNNVIQKCTRDRGNGLFCKNPKCEQ